VTRNVCVPYNGACLGPVYQLSGTVLLACGLAVLGPLSKRRLRLSAPPPRGREEPCWHAGLPIPWPCASSHSPGSSSSSSTGGGTCRLQAAPSILLVRLLTLTLTLTLTLLDTTSDLLPAAALGHRALGAYSEGKALESRWCRPITVARRPWCVTGAGSKRRATPPASQPARGAQGITSS